uniref:Uncharacterized protein n=1 Tax=Chromera velia CCMP2878 TaxID=1169474 RepID=A0A0G4G8W0_9ALVE|eukprot:Cvel_20780.t1-p1 / transcript=Cvel_20780.t1 / gene=Cvel_20780 / organism=Chromera_velia_CCMP2878 / gene_product=hypothetical protein / transcript_product=hypothetical protein / location=Cvel_scaffold1896:26961-31505(+) / protein_length=650 / sequence_SO=supercontig / SO=protein_coding / is_pseudo=false
MRFYIFSFGVCICTLLLTSSVSLSESQREGQSDSLFFSRQSEKPHIIHHTAVITSNNARSHAARVEEDREKEGKRKRAAELLAKKEAEKKVKRLQEDAARRKDFMNKLQQIKHAIERGSGAKRNPIPDFSDADVDSLESFAESTFETARQFGSMSIHGKTKSYTSFGYFPETSSRYEDVQFLIRLHRYVFTQPPTDPVLHHAREYIVASAIATIIADACLHNIFFPECNPEKIWQNAVEGMSTTNEKGPETFATHYERAVHDSQYLISSALRRDFLGMPTASDLVDPSGRPNFSRVARTAERACATLNNAPKCSIDYWKAFKQTVFGSTNKDLADSAEANGGFFGLAKKAIATYLGEESSPPADGQSILDAKEVFVERFEFGSSWSHGPTPLAVFLGIGGDPGFKKFGALAEKYEASKRILMSTCEAEKDLPGCERVFGVLPLGASLPDAFSKGLLKEGGNIIQIGETMRMMAKDAFALITENTMKWWTPQFFFPGESSSLENSVFLGLLHVLGGVMTKDPMAVKKNIPEHFSKIFKRKVKSSSSSGIFKACGGKENMSFNKDCVEHDKKRNIYGALINTIPEAVCEESQRSPDNLCLLALLFLKCIPAHTGTKANNNVFGSIARLVSDKVNFSGQKIEDLEECKESSSF